MGSLSLSRQHCWSQYNIAHSETSLRGDVQAWEQQVCGMCLGSVESRFLDVKVPHVATNTSISVEDVGSGGLCCGEMRFWSMFLSLQYGNFMGLPQTIFHLHVSYRGSDGSEGLSVCADEQQTEAQKREKAKVLSNFFILQNNELACINQGPHH